MLPRHGAVYGIFLLAYAARLSPRRNLDEWIEAARATSSFLARAIDLGEPAKALIRFQLVEITDRVALASPLHLLSETADRATLLGLARLLLGIAPPVWLHLAINNGNVEREYIPTDDLEALTWLEPDLDRLLLDTHAHARLYDDQQDLRKRVGDAAELFLMAAFAYAGARPVHVARLSDAYGYDIELRGQSTDRIEIKAASPKTRGRFYLSRNEYEKSCAFGNEWRLLQVIFTREAFVAGRLDHSHVQEILRLKPEGIRSIVPPDTERFIWMESAQLVPDQSMWELASIKLDPDFTLPGFQSNPAN
jgi:hypothetical protein